MSYAQLGMAKLLVCLFAWSHLQSCMWGLVPQMTGESPNWIEALQLLHPDQTLTDWDKCVSRWDVVNPPPDWLTRSIIRASLSPPPLSFMPLHEVHG